MNHPSSLRSLARGGALAAAAAALMALAACGLGAPANNAAAGNAAANATAANAAPAAPAAASAANVANAAGGAAGAASNGAPGMGAPYAAGPADQGQGGPADQGGPAGGQGRPGGGMDASALGAAVGSPGPQASANGDTAGNDAYDRQFINACFHANARASGSTDRASRYCTCVMSELDRLSLPAKQALTSDSPEVVRAQNDCRG